MARAYRHLIRATAARLLLAAAVVCGATAGPASARVYIGLGVPLFYPPMVVAPPAYYPPLAYYPPYYAPPYYPPPGSTFSYTPPSAMPRSLAPPRRYAPSGGYAGGDAARSCRAGAYVCPLVEDIPPGAPCLCPGHGGRRIRGEAD